MDTLRLLKWILSIPKFEKEILGFDSVPLLQSIFRENFLKSCSLKSNSDDLIFLIFNSQKTSSLSSSTTRLNALFGLIQSPLKINVFRQSSLKIPLSDPSIDWHSTISLNLLLQKFHFKIHFSICTQTSSKHYQILSKHCIPVYPSPSHHSVIYKEITEEYSYPEINFSVDNFDEYLHGIVVNGLETIYVELIATSSSSSLMTEELNKECDKEYSQHGIFSTAIHYETLLEACSKKNQLVKRHGQTFGLIRALDPSGNGTRIELIIKRKIKRSLSDSESFIEQQSRVELLPEASSSEREFTESINETEERQDNLEFYLLNRIRNRVKLLSNHQRQGLTIGLEDLFGCNDILMDDTRDIDPWKQRGFQQSLSQCRKIFQLNHEALNVCVTRIALPIDSILPRIVSS